MTWPEAIDSMVGGACFLGLIGAFCFIFWVIFGGRDE